MATLTEKIAQLRSEGFSEREIYDTLHDMQATGFGRYVGMGLGEAISGAESSLELPFRGVNWAIDKANPLITGAGLHAFPNVPNVPGYIRQGTDWMGLTDQPQYVPGMGPYPEAERLGAAAVRGVGAGLGIGGPIAAGIGAASGVTSEVAHEMFPNSTAIPIAVGVGTGLLGGGLAGALTRGGPAAAAPSVEDVAKGIKADLGYPNATLTTAGRAIRNELNAGNLGLRPVSKLDPNLVEDLVKMKRPDSMASRLLQDPDALATLQLEMPEATDHLFAGMLQRNPQQWRNMVDKSRNALATDAAHQEALDAALSSPGKVPNVEISKPERIGRLLVGEGIGIAARHLGLFPEGVSDYMAGFGGMAATKAFDALRSHVAARSILEPWIGTGMSVGGMAGEANVGPAAPPLGFRMAQ